MIVSFDSLENTFLLYWSSTYQEKLKQTVRTNVKDSLLLEKSVIFCHVFLKHLHALNTWRHLGKAPYLPNELNNISLSIPVEVILGIFDPRTPSPTYFLYLLHLLSLPLQSKEKSGKKSISKCAFKYFHFSSDRTHLAWMSFIDDALCKRVIWWWGYVIRR